MTNAIRSVAKRAIGHPERSTLVRQALLALPRTVKQTDMAEALGVDDSIMSRLLSGKRGFSDDVLKRMAEWR